jgi:hypothetical protein
LDKENRDVQDALGRARVIYEFSTTYAESTAADQVGAVMPVASSTSATGVEEVEIPADAAADLERQIAEQRAAEQAAINAAVEAANAEVEAARLAAEAQALKE